MNDAWLTSNIKVVKNVDDISFFDKIKKNIIINKINLYLRNKSYLYLYIKGVTTDPSKRWFLADKALYNKISGICKLFGNVKLQKGQSFLTGDYAEVDLNRGISKLLPAPSSNNLNENRVRALIDKNQKLEQNEPN